MKQKITKLKLTIKELNKIRILLIKANKIISLLIIRLVKHFKTNKNNNIMILIRFKCFRKSSKTH